MKNKKLVIGCILGILVLCIVGFGGFHLYRKNTNVVSVVPVELLNSDWGMEYEGTSGVVSNSLSQTIVPDTTQAISKIYVKAGQKVKIGDKILTYDMSTKKLDLELKSYDVQELEFSIKRAEKDLSNLKKGIVTEGYDSQGYDTLGKRNSLLASIVLRSAETSTDHTAATTAVTDGTRTSTDATTGTTDATTASTEATTQEPTETTTATTSGTETTTENTEDSTSEIDVKDPTSGKTEKEDDKDDEDKSNNSSYDDESETDDSTPSYTASEIKDMISAKETEIRELKLQLKEEKLEYDMLEKEVEDGTVKAAVAGTVKEVNKPEDAAAMGDPVVVIVSEDKLYVKGTVDEFSYHMLTPGMVINATSWDTGGTFQATVTEISNYPVTGDYYNSGNSNVSYYPFTAVIEEDTIDVSTGETVTINFDQSTSQDAGCLYIPLAYVRTEGNKSYVYISDENERLKKQTVVTGQTLYNTVIEIKDGLSVEDYVAFPYGNDVKEGAKTVISEDDADIVY